MIRVRNESDFRNWFIDNHKKLGFSKIIQSSTKSCPDFVMQEGDKEVRVELEIKSSNFNLHNHSPKEVDKVICIIEDEKLDTPTRVISGIRLMEFEEGESSYSYKKRIEKLFKNEILLTTPDVMSKLNISWNTATISLMDLALDGKIERIKKEGITLWLPKK